MEAWRSGRGSDTQAPAVATVTPPVFGSAWVRPHEVLGEAQPKAAKTVVCDAPHEPHAHRRGRLNATPDQHLRANSLCSNGGDDPQRCQSLNDGTGYICRIGFVRHANVMVMKRDQISFADADYLVAHLPQGVGFDSIRN